MKSVFDLDLIPSHIAVIREVHREKTATRVDIARDTGLSTQSLTRLTKTLLDEGLLVEGERRVVGRGQPAVYLSIKPGKFVSYGLVFEHDQITCLATELGGDQLFYLKRRWEYGKALDALKAAEIMLQSAVNESPDDAIALGVGVSISGFFFEDGSRKIVSRNDVEGWRDIDIPNDLSVPLAMPVLVENDARAAAIGQAVDGIGRDIDSFFLMLMTKGIGGGFVFEGKLIRGRLGNAGEVAKFVPSTPSLKRPTAESLMDFLQERWGIRPSDAQIEKAIKQEDPALTKWLDDAAESLGPAIRAITALLDPKAIVLAGRLSPAIRKALARRLKVEGISYAGIEAPAPELIVDSGTDCLSVGASSLPVAEFLYKS